MILFMISRCPPVLSMVCHKFLRSHWFLLRKNVENVNPKSPNPLLLPKRSNMKGSVYHSFAVLMLVMANLWVVAGHGTVSIASSVSFRSNKQDTSQGGYVFGFEVIQSWM
jgi:hypothetical protein